MKISIKTDEYAKQAKENVITISEEMFSQKFAEVLSEGCFRKAVRTEPSLLEVFAMLGAELMCSLFHEEEN